MAPFPNTLHKILREMILNETSGRLGKPKKLWCPWCTSWVDERRMRAHVDRHLSELGELYDESVGTTDGEEGVE